MKFFSVEWMAQSHQEEVASPPKPHIPCLVQPRQPTFGKGYLQPKPRPSKVLEPASQDADLDASTCASPISDVSGYSSGYESEAASSECPSVEEEESRTRRVRTKFTPEQIRKLEKIFNKHKYLDATEREKTAVKLELSETQIRTWFQNRRMKLKREVQDMNSQIPSVLFHHHHQQQQQFSQFHDVRAHYAPGFYPRIQQHPSPLMIPHFY